MMGLLGATKDNNSLSNAIDLLSKLHKTRELQKKIEFVVRPGHSFFAFLALGSNGGRSRVHVHGVGLEEFNELTQKVEYHLHLGHLPLLLIIVGRVSAA